MNPLISAQQTSFFQQNGYIELESLLSNTECETLQTEIKELLLLRLKRDPNRVPSKDVYKHGRDLWRGKEPIKTLLLSRKMTSVALGLSNKSSLRLACDQWIPHDFPWTTPVKIKDLFSLQGLACVFLIRMQTPSEEETINPTFRQEPGLVPLPEKQGNALIVNPNMLLNLPKLTLYTPTDLYVVAYSLPTTVYIHNKEDPMNAELKSMGYNFGDCLNNDRHPLVSGR